MTRPFAESVVEQGLNSVRVEEGRVLNVNLKRWTVDVRASSTGRAYLDVTWGNSYLHFTEGEGIFCMPEVGAKVKICRPSDSDPFVMCFTAPMERRSGGEQGGLQTDPQESDGGSDVTFRAGRPPLQQGDIMLRTRDGNQVWLHRGGVVEIGATSVSKRLYIPLLNYIRDLCENYELWTGGGALSWTTTRSDQNPEDEAFAVLGIACRRASQDALASVALRMGRVDETKRFRLEIAPQLINPRTFETQSDPVYVMEIDEEGVIDEEAKDWNLTLNGELDWTISSSMSVSVEGNISWEGRGNHELKVQGKSTQEMQALSIRSQTSAVIDCPNIQLGGPGATTPAVLASPALIAYIVGHIHPISGPSTGPPSPTVLPLQYQAQKIRGQ
jgi:hypothetical protein